MTSITEGPWFDMDINIENSSISNSDRIMTKGARVGKDSKGRSGKGASLKVSMVKYGGDTRRGNRDHAESECSMEKRDKKKCDRRTLKGKVYKTMVRPAMLYGAET